jgi:hypothetical protein
VLKKDYFTKAPHDGEVDYINDFWRRRWSRRVGRILLTLSAHYESYIKRIRQAHPSAISFINPPIFDSPPNLSEEIKQGRMALSSHFYDGLTLLGKRRHKFNAVSFYKHKLYPLSLINPKDAVGLQRGLRGMLSALKFGSKSIRTGMRTQFEELKSDAEKIEGIAENEEGTSYPSKPNNQPAVPADIVSDYW